MVWNADRPPAGQGRGYEKELRLNGGSDQLGALTQGVRREAPRRYCVDGALVRQQRTIRRVLSRGTTTVVTAASGRPWASVLRYISCTAAPCRKRPKNDTCTDRDRNTAPGATLSRSAGLA